MSKCGYMLIASISLIILLCLRSTIFSCQRQLPASSAFEKQVKRREPRRGTRTSPACMAPEQELAVGGQCLLEHSLCPFLLVPYRSSGYVINQGGIDISELLYQEASLKIRYRVDVAFFPTVFEPSRVLIRDLRIDRFQAALLRIVNRDFHIFSPQSHQ